MLMVNQTLFSKTREMFRAMTQAHWSAASEHADDELLAINRL
jgi:hypothetical protein